MVYAIEMITHDMKYAHQFYEDRLRNTSNIKGISSTI
jgi:hypothetical protein